MRKTEHFNNLIIGGPRARRRFMKGRISEMASGIRHDRDVIAAKLFSDSEFDHNCALMAIKRIAGTWNRIVDSADKGGLLGTRLEAECRKLFLSELGQAALGGAGCIGFAQTTGRRGGGTIPATAGEKNLRLIKRLYRVEVAGQTVWMAYVMTTGDQGATYDAYKKLVRVAQKDTGGLCDSQMVLGRVALSSKNFAGWVFVAWQHHSHQRVDGYGVHHSFDFTEAA